MIEINNFNLFNRKIVLEANVSDKKAELLGLLLQYYTGNNNNESLVDTIKYLDQNLDDIPLSDDDLIAYLQEHILVRDF